MSSLGVMEDDADGMAMPRTQAADTMPQVDAIRPARALHRAMMHREGYSVTLAKRNHLRSRLHTRTLFGQYKFPTAKILPRFGQQDGHLYREDVLAVKILMQAIVVALPVLEQQWRWLHLPGIVTSPNEVRVRLRIADLDAHRGVPTMAIGASRG